MKGAMEEHGKVFPTLVKTIKALSNFRLVMHYVYKTYNGRGISFSLDLKYCKCKPDLRFMQYIYS